MTGIASIFSCCFIVVYVKSLCVWALCLTIPSRVRVCNSSPHNALSYLPDAAWEDQLDARSGHSGAYSGSKLHNLMPIYASYSFSKLYGTVRNLLGDKGDLDGDSWYPRGICGKQESRSVLSWSKPRLWHTMQLTNNAGSYPRLFVRCLY